MARFLKTNRLNIIIGFFSIISLGFWSLLFLVPKMRQLMGHYSIPPLNFTIAIYVFIVLMSLLVVYSLFAFLIYRQKKYNINFKLVIVLFVLTMAVLAFIFPLMSSDVLNYPVYTRIFSKYSDNPYLAPPVAYPDDWFYKNYANHGFEGFVMPYGPLWLSISVLPTWIGGDNINITLLLFKILAIIFNIGCIVLIYKITEQLRPKLKIPLTLLYAFNPFILFEVVVEGHNDIVMAFFVLLALFFLIKEKHVCGFVFLVCSTLVKFISILLWPVFIIYIWKKAKKKIFIKIFFTTCFLIAVFFLAYSLNMAGVKNILLRGQLFNALYSSFLVNIIMGIARAFSISGLMVIKISLFVIFSVSSLYVLISQYFKKRAGKADLIHRCILIYILFFLLICFYFRGWYLVWLLPLLLLSGKRTHLILFFLLTWLGIMRIFYNFAIVSFTGTFLFIVIIFAIYFYKIVYDKNQKKLA